MDLNSDILLAIDDDSVSRSAMGGMHQRSLSLSAKWANDKSMAIEYLRRQREVMTWIESVLKRELPSTDLFEALKSGVVLREMMELLFPDASNCTSPISRKYSNRMAPWKERENISVFLRQCKSIGMNDLSLFCTDDLYEGTNMVQVLFCVQHFKMFSEDHAGHRFKCVTTNEVTEFSNQELEMAMSKIEQAGVDVTALKGLITSGSPLVVPEKIAVYEKETAVREASELNAALAKQEQLESINEDELTNSSEGKVVVEVQVCNQMSDDQQDIDNPADDDDVSPEQDYGSDAGDEQQAANAQDNFVLARATDHDVDSPSAQDEEIRMIIQLVLSEMASKIEEAVTQLLVEQDVPTVEVKFDVPIEEVALALEEGLQAMSTKPATELVVEINAENDSQINFESEEATVPTADLMLEGAGKTLDQAGVEVEVTEENEEPAADATDIPIESTPVEDATSAQSVAATAETPAEQQDMPQPTEEENLEAKAMSKCMCGSCTIM